MDTVLITGGCGYIGSHTCVSLIENKYNILIIDSHINSFENSFDNIKKVVENKGFKYNEQIQYIKGDIRNKVWLDEIFNDFNKSQKPIKFVIHFAGLKSIYSSIKFPLEYWESNILSTLSLLAVMKKYKCFSLIFSSSATVYKPQGSKLLKETDELSPSTPYGKTKLCIEEVLKDLYESNKEWRIANLRYFNPVGSHTSGLLEENPKGKESNLFPAILRVIRGDKKKLLVYGKDWPTHDGTCIRDFIHVMDLAEAHIATLEFLIKNKPQYISINIGTGKGNSVLKVIETFQEIEGIDFAYEFVGRRLGDQPVVIAENKLALKLLKWKPRRTLFDMCSDSVNKKNI